MADDDDRERERDDQPDQPDEGDDSAQAKAQREQQEVEEAKEQMEEIEEGDPPEKLEDWPGGKAKYQTYGGPDAETGYEDGATAKLGPSNLRHHPDGSVTIDGEEVEDPDEYKGEPIPGGPSDPDAPPDPAMIGQEDEDEDEKGEGGDEASSDSSSDSDSDGQAEGEAGDDSESERAAGSREEG
jgi:hypothetical protein